MLAILIGLAAASGSSADIRPLLRDQGFAGPINGRETIEFVGQISQGNDDYQIYLYRGVFRAAVVDHGVNRLIVILNGSILIGAYDSSLATSCKVRGQKVICNTEDRGVIEFTKRGPPAKVLFDGYLEEIAYGNRTKGWQKQN